MILYGFTIDRTSLSLDPLELTETNGYIIDRDNFGAAGVSWERGLASAPDYHGDTLVRARKVNSTWAVQVRVVGTSASDAQTKLSALCDAMSQFSYTVTITEDGVGKVWDAEPADWQVGGDIMLDSVQSHTYQLVLTVPVYPIPAAV